MIRQSDPHSWSERLASWQESLDRKWKSWLEHLFLRLVHWLTWTYAAVVVLVWLLLHLAGDRWWPATLLLFGPRWLGLLPLLVLVPLALALRPRLLRLIAVVAALFFFGVLGFCIPWPWHFLPVDPSGSLSLLTCNAHNGAGGWDRFRQLLFQQSPDIVALQEIGRETEVPFPDDWHVVREGQLVIGSPYAIKDVQTWYRREPTMQWPPLLAIYAVVDCPGRPVAVCNIHLTSPQHGITETLDRHTLVNVSRAERLRGLNQLRQQESEALSAWLSELPRVDVVMGDFNMPVESRIYREWWSDYSNAFSRVGFGLGYTRWVRLHNFEYGARIDHILTGDQWNAVRCGIGRDVGSDHMPVVAMVRWSGNDE